MGLGGKGQTSMNYPMGQGSNPLGMMGLDLSLYNTPVVGAFFANPNEQFQREQMSKAGEAYTAYRPEQAQARMNALANQLSVMQPAQNALNRMYGDAGNLNTGQALTNPMGPSMMGQGASLPSQNPNQGGKFGGKGKGKGKGGKGKGGPEIKSLFEPETMLPEHLRTGPSMTRLPNGMLQSIGTTGGATTRAIGGRVNGY